MIDLTVTTNILGQEEPANGGLRFLQEGIEDALIIRFEVVLVFRSTSDDYDLEGLVFSAWDDEADEEAYILGLQMGSPVFDGVAIVLVEVDGYVPPKIVEPEGQGDDTNIAVIAGASVGGAALLILVAFLFVRRRNGKDNPVNNEGPRAPSHPVPKIAVST
jgi:hypothetical protein